MQSAEGTPPGADASGSGRVSGPGPPPRRVEEERFPAELRVTMTLLQAAARTERDIAETMREMAAHAEGEIAARRLMLAEEALRGAREADERAEHLQQLARQWAVHTDVVKLHRLLADATRALTSLANTQQAIADAFTSLASQDGSALAAQRRQLAAAAAAGARDAWRQAQDLHQLAETGAAGMPPPNPPHGG